MTWMDDDNPEPLDDGAPHALGVMGAIVLILMSLGLAACVAAMWVLVWKMTQLP